MTNYSNASERDANIMIGNKRYEKHFVNFAGKKNKNTCFIQKKIYIYIERL